MTRKLIQFDDIPTCVTSNLIKVVGVGGGGCNAVRNMYDEGIKDVAFAVANTDSMVLEKSPVAVKVLLGDSGLGAGGNPEVGKEEAEKSEEKIGALFDDETKMVFITATMGGGTGTGAGPVVVRIAKSMGKLTIGIVTIPFYFEKERKIIKALKGVEEMKKNVDALLIINNERLCDIYSDSRMTVMESFKVADNVLCDAVKSISELITIEGYLNLDFRDVESTMKAGGGAIMAIGRASGELRVQNAILDALNSPLLYGCDVSKAKRILFNIYTGPNAPLIVNELKELDAFMDELDPMIDVIWDESEDNSLGEDVKIAILATGLDDEDYGFRNVAKHDTDTDAEYYSKMIRKLYRTDTDKKDLPTSDRNIQDSVDAQTDIPFIVTNAEQQGSTSTSGESRDNCIKDYGDEHIESELEEDTPEKEDYNNPASSFLQRVMNRIKTFAEKSLVEE